MNLPLVLVFAAGIGIFSPLAAHNSNGLAAGRASGSAPVAATASDRVVISGIDGGQSIRIVVADASLMGSRAQILDESGQEITELSIKHVVTVDVKSWPAGTYMLRLVDGRSLPIVRK